MRIHAAHPSRRLILVALLAVFLHAALPLMHGLLSAPARGFYTTLCVVGGPAQQYWVALEDPAQPGHDQTQVPQCPLCVAGAHFALQPPARIALDLHADLHQARPVRSLLPPAQQQAPAAYRSRAPPVLSA